MYNSPRTKVATGNPDVIQFGSLDRDNVLVRHIRAHLITLQLRNAAEASERAMAREADLPAFLRRQAD